jgi:hypothetical protein
MTITASRLFADFPEFADIEKYPLATIDFWIVVAGRMLAADRWGDLLDIGTELFVAHNLVLAARDQMSGANGGLGGSGSGVVASKTVDKVSVSYDTAAASVVGAGNWNLTTYGTRYIQLARMVGAGGVQL